MRLLLVGPGGRAGPLHADHPDRGHLRQGEPRDDVGRLRRPARLLGRRASSSAASLYLRVKNRSAWLLVIVLDRRDRRRLPRPRRRRHAARRLPDLRDRRARQRRPVDRRHDGPAGAHAARLPGRHHGPDGVARRGHARRRLPARRRDRRARARDPRRCRRYCRRRAPRGLLAVDSVPRSPAVAPATPRLASTAPRLGARVLDRRRARRPRRHRAAREDDRTAARDPSAGLSTSQPRALGRRDAVDDGCSARARPRRRPAAPSGGA